MIHAIYDREAHKLTVTGHALYAEYGKDLVCCAVSTLVFTLASSVAENFPDEHEVRFDKSGAEIICRSRDDENCKLLFDQICSGLEMVEAKYPDYVKLTRLGVENGGANTVS